MILSNLEGFVRDHYGFLFAHSLAFLHCRKSWLFSGVLMPFSQLAGHSVSLISHLSSTVHTTAAAISMQDPLTAHGPVLVRHVP